MANPLHILNISLGHGRAGSGVFAVALAKKLTNLGHHVIQACSPETFTHLQAKREELPCYFEDLTSLYEFKKAKKLAQFCNDQKIQIINSHGSGERYLAIFSKLFFGCKAKIVITRHAVSGTAPFFGTLIYNLGADMNIAVSQIVYRSLQKDITFKKRLIYGGIDIDKFLHPNFTEIERLKKAVFQKSLGRPIIGMVADYDPKGKNDRGHGKGHSVLFEAVKHLPQKVFLVLVGPLPDHCNALMALALSMGLKEDQIMILPFQNDVLHYYYVMDIHVLPSFSESLGLVTLEAMAAGVASIGSDIGGINEIIQDKSNGLLFKKGDSVDLGNQITLFLNNPSIKMQLAIAGKETVEKRFNMTRVANETIALFDELMGHV